MIGIGIIGIIYCVGMFIYNRINFHWSGYDADQYLFLIPLFVESCLLTFLGIMSI